MGYVPADLIKVSRPPPRPPVRYRKSKYANSAAGEMKYKITVEVEVSDGDRLNWSVKEPDWRKSGERRFAKSLTFSQGGCGVQDVKLSGIGRMVDAAVEKAIARMKKETASAATRSAPGEAQELPGASSHQTEKRTVEGTPEPTV